MKNKTYASINILIVGAGKATIDFAANLTFTDYRIFIVDKNADENHRIFKSFENIQLSSIEEALPICDFIVIATEPEDARKVAYQLGDVRRKVVIDATNPSAGTATPTFYKHFNTVNAIKAITGSRDVIKAFFACEYENVSQPSPKKEKTDVLVAGNSKKAKALIKILADDMGCSSYCNLGGDNAIPLLNTMAIAWHDVESRQNVLEHIAAHTKA